MRRVILIPRCRATGCGERSPHPLCRPHWDGLPDDVQTSIGENTFTAWHRASFLVLVDALRALEVADQGIEWTVGRRMPVVEGDGPRLLIWGIQ